MPSNKRYIAVDRAEVTRCKWCGTTESKRWIQSTRESELYCSDICVNADSENSTTRCAMFFISIGVVIVIVDSIIFIVQTQSAGFSWNNVSLNAIFLHGIALTFYILCPLIFEIRHRAASRRAREKVPKNSRIKDAIFDERYLQCENCGAPLDVENGNTSVRCSHCGIINRVSYISS